MHEDNIEILWRRIMHTSADNCPMEFAKALAERAALAERERWETAAMALRLATSLPCYQYRKAPQHSQGSDNLPDDYEV
mgnify:FL=1